MYSGNTSNNLDRQKMDGGLGDSSEHEMNSLSTVCSVLQFGLTVRIFFSSIFSHLTF